MSNLPSGVQNGKLLGAGTTLLQGMWTAPSKLRCVDPFHNTKFLRQDTFITSMYQQQTVYLFQIFPFFKKKSSSVQEKKKWWKWNLEFDQEVV